MNEIVQTQIQALTTCVYDSRIFSRDRQISGLRMKVPQRGPGMECPGGALGAKLPCCFCMRILCLRHSVEPRPLLTIRLRRLRDSQGPSCEEQLPLSSAVAETPQNNTDRYKQYTLIETIQKGTHGTDGK